MNVALPAGGVQHEGDDLVTYEDRAGASGQPFYRSFRGPCGSAILGRGAG